MHLINLIIFLSNVHFEKCSYTFFNHFSKTETSGLGKGFCSSPEPPAECARGPGSVLRLSRLYSTLNLQLTTPRTFICSLQHKGRTEPESIHLSKVVVSRQNVLYTENSSFPSPLSLLVSFFFQGNHKLCPDFHT